MKVLDTNVSAQQSRKLLVCIINQKKSFDFKRFRWKSLKGSISGHLDKHWRDKSRVVHKTNGMQTAVGFAWWGSEQLECNWQSAVIWPLEASQKQTEQGILI